MLRIIKASLLLVGGQGGWLITVLLATLVMDLVVHVVRTGLFNRNNMVRGASDRLLVKTESL